MVTVKIGNSKLFRIDVCDKNKVINMLATFMLGSEAIILSINSIIRFFVQNTYKLDTFLIYLIVFILGIIAVPEILRNIHLVDICVIVLWCLIMFFSITLKGTDQSVSKGIITSFICESIPAYFIFMSIRDWDDFWRKIYRISYFVIIGIALCLFVFHTVSTDMDVYSVSYSQYLGYILIAPSSILGFSFAKKNNICDFVMLVFSLLLIFMAGARLPLLIPIIAFCVAKFINVKLSIKKIVGIIVFLSTFIIVWCNLDYIIVFITPFLTKIGASSRLLLILSNQIDSVDSTRNLIYSAALNYIKEHPIWGCGLGNDRQIILSVTGLHEDVVGMYPHNLILEILMQFGALFGLIIIIGLVVITIRAIKCDYLHNKDFVCLFLCIGVIPLMVSKSYLEYKYFYMFLGIVIGRLRNLYAYEKSNI